MTMTVQEKKLGMAFEKLARYCDGAYAAMLTGDRLEFAEQVRDAVRVMKELQPVFHEALAAMIEEIEGDE